VFEHSQRGVGWRASSIVLGLAAILLLGPAHADEIRIAVAANFAGAMDELVSRFEALGEDEVRVSTGSTGSQYAQIRNGAPFDAFFAADARRPALLEEAGVAVAGSRFTYALGRLALWSRRPEYVDAQGRVLELGDYRHLAIANPELAPYGAAAREVLQSRALWDALQSRGRLVRGQDVGQTFSFVYSGSAELGFVAYSQLKTRGPELDGSHWLVPASLHAPIEQQAVLLRDVPAARRFLEFVQSPAGREIVRAHGYGP